jgi:hypothetical protein
MLLGLHSQIVLSVTYRMYSLDLVGFFHTIDGQVFYLTGRIATLVKRGHLEEIC